MSQQYRDYLGSAVGQQGCTYSRLGNIYAGQSQADDGAPAMNTYIVPKLCPNGPAPNYPPRYDTLSHGANYLCGGYFSVKNAYPTANCGPCNAEYVDRPCRGFISCNGNGQ